ncbi:MAG: hydantoinase B/oxoprolinase family protein [Verrucomicrobiota bacterium]
MTWKIFADTGGTFTDCLGQDKAGNWHTCKVLSDGTLRGEVKRIDDAERKVWIEIKQSFAPHFFAGYSVRWQDARGGACVLNVESSAGNWLRAGRASPLPKVGDILQISAGEEAPVLGARVMTQTLLSEPLQISIFNLATTRGTNALLEEKGAHVLLFVAEGFEDLLVIDDQRRPDIFALEHSVRPVLTRNVVGLPLRRRADGTVEKTCSDAELEKRVREAVEHSEAEAVAVCLPHSYAFPGDERRVGRILKNCGVSYVALSTDLSRLGKYLPRTQTAVVDAYLGPIMEAYLSRVMERLEGSELRIMTSAGGLLPQSSYRAKDGLLSGPAGGITGVEAVARRAGFSRVLAFDMGGTSTDVSRVDGELELKNQHQVGPARIQAAALRIETVAAGGGSICGVCDGQFYVGPESAGAYPGPACYGAGGPLTVTDVNLLLGLIRREHFQVPIDESASQRALDVWMDQIPLGKSGERFDRDTVLRAFRDIANERMADALRLISIKEGFDPADFTMVAFGGAGGQHACSLARLAGMSRVLIPAHAGILSAYGLSQAREALIEMRRVQKLLGEGEELSDFLDELLGKLRIRAARELEQYESWVDLEIRFQGQETSLDLRWNGHADEIATLFKERYRALFGYVPEGRRIEVVNARCCAQSRSENYDQEHFEIVRKPEDRLEVIPDPYTTMVVEPGWQVLRGSEGSTLMEFVGHSMNEETDRDTTALLQDTLIHNRVQGIVVEMGEQLERTAVSTNVKERLDFSCALTDPEGILLFNAPHIPVHLGALGVCVRRVLEVLDLEAGDVAITNHPGFGGSHLPDITLIAPIFVDGQKMGYAVNRAHHAEVGGISPGSMTPFARTLEEEGVVIYPIHLIRKGADCFEAIESLLTSAPYPSRRVEENLADLRAQLAALKAGISGLRAVADVFGREAYLSYVREMLSFSEKAMENRIHSIGQNFSSGISMLDDSDCVKVNIRAESGRLKIDFTGTSPVRADSLNANEAITRSAILYVLRLWLGDSVSMNEGVLKRVDLCLPESLISPVFYRDPKRCAAVVGGNVEISQRIVDALMQALELQAGSQATMNNLIFGDEKKSYYETICGGSGAGPEYNGSDAIHTHMTNTAITDLEILEERYPVVLEKFEIREASGGRGRYVGGNGIRRTIRFLKPMTVSLLALSRLQGGRGLKGGETGEAGRQFMIRSGEYKKLDGLFSQEFRTGDALEVETPGGGGCGLPESESQTLS